jgi:hypothetical protein
MDFNFGGSVLIISQLEKLARFMEKDAKPPHHGFQMATFYSPTPWELEYWKENPDTTKPDEDDWQGRKCKTIADISVWAVAMEHGWEKVRDHIDGCDSEEIARFILEIDEETTKKLFRQGENITDLKLVTLPMAIRAIRTLDQTGVVTWE